VGRGREKAVGGLIWATLAVRGGKILHAIVNGDWHPRPLASVGWLEEALVGAAANSATIRQRMETFLARDDVEFAGVTADDLVTAFDKALADRQPEA
jgi:lipoate-protein ligase A